ncbi:MAG: PEP-CTERM sorting domain-containing protein [Pirellulales bacterium]|nr:PEP-CTERM sorting domain-containing protein [Pirellulales bacterium]
MCFTRHGCRWIGASLIAGFVLVGVRPAQAEVLSLGSEETASLMGWVYCDINNDAVRDDNERAISGVRILLEGETDDGQDVSRSLKTGTDGAFLFDDLQPGTYSLTQFQPERYVEGKPNASGTAGGTTAKPNQITGIVLNAGDQATGYFFGEYGLKSKYITKKSFLVVIPEPATLWLAVAGLPALGLLLRRHRRHP